MVFMVIAKTGVKSEVLTHISEDLSPIPAVISRAVLIPGIGDPENRFQHEGEYAVLVNEFQRVEGKPEILLVLKETVLVDVSERRVQFKVKIPQVKIEFLLLPFAELCTVFRGSGLL
jgi:hypothetical protein